MALPAPSAAKWALSGLLPPSSGAYVDAAQDFGASANGNVLLPFSTLQQAYDAGAFRLTLAPGTYGSLALGAGGFAVIVGDQITNSIGAVTGSGAPTAFFLGVDVDGAQSITDAGGGFYVYIGCEIGVSGPVAFSGGSVGGHGEIQIESCDFGFACTFNNFRDFLVDDYSERQMLAAGCTFTSTTAPMGLVCLGTNANARILSNADAALPFALRHVLPMHALTTPRTYTLDMSGAAVGDVMTFDTYNNSGQSALVNLGGVTLYTAASSAVAKRVKLECTVAGTTAVFRTAEPLTSPTL